jgi:hypothetical protein
MSRCSPAHLVEYRVPVDCLRTVASVSTGVAAQSLSGRHRIVCHVFNGVRIVIRVLCEEDLVGAMVCGVALVHDALGLCALIYSA